MTYTAGPFDSAHLYVQWGGKLPGNEQWSCGFRMRKKTSGTVDSGAGLLVGIGAAIATYHTANETRLSPLAKLSFVKVNAVGTDGKYIGSGTNQALYADSPGGNTDPNIPPNQITLAVSLLTGFSRGPAHEGRFYLPMCSTPVVSNGIISSTVATGIRDKTTAMITAVNAVNADYEMAIFSRKAGAPGNRRITGVKVGLVLDTQRRRRRSLAEAYV